MELSQKTETSLALFQSRGANYAHHIGLSPPRFLTSQCSYYVMYDGRLLKLYNMSDDFEFLSVSNRIHQQKKEKKNLSISALIALEIPPSFICCLHDMLLLVSRFMRSLLPTPQRNSFIPALLMTFVKKSMNLIRFPQISSSTFILFTNSNHGMAIIFIFFEMFFFKQSLLGTVWN